jgi:tetratricopeptide (TPR) repeat protein
MYRIALFPVIGLVLVSAANSQVTFNRDIAPIVYQHCSPCHHAGGSGPFPLTTYGEVSHHANQIVNVTARRYMPPWPPERGVGTFAGDRSLTQEQIQLFADWLKQGKHEGDAANLPTAPKFSSDWQLGPPDLILKMPKPFVLPAQTSDVFRNFLVPNTLKQTKFVRALELRLTNPRVVHHANVVLDRTQSLRPRDGEDGKPGFPGMDVITEAAPDNFDPDSHFLFWKPATVLRPTPDDMSWRLDPDTDLILNLHLQATGKPEAVQAEIGLYFSAKPPTEFPMLLQLEHDSALKIPPGDRTFRVSDSLTLPVAVQLLAIYPHAHYLGKTIDAWAVLPNGERKPLIRIPDWDINWQAEYDYAQPISLPKGTKVAMQITYDNSSQNPRNPHRPPQQVNAGNRSEDEMGHVWLQVLPARPEDRLLLQEAVMRRRLEKDPSDFVAHYNLGAVEQERGELKEAAANYQAALDTDSQNATARNGLAAVLMMQDQLPDAITQLRTILAANPSYLNARYNLGRSLAATGDYAGAAEQFDLFVRERPDDAQAQADLATVLYKQGKVPEALNHLRQAAKEAPGNADIQANFGTLLAITGDKQGAIEAFQNALRIDPNHAAAKANLQKLHALR